jgi:hypothetical protein
MSQITIDMFHFQVPGGSMSWQLDYLTTHTSLSPIRRGFVPGFVSYKKGCSRLAAASDKVYQLLAHGRWFSPGTLASSTNKTGRHDIAEILLKVALNTINQIKSNQSIFIVTTMSYFPLP